MTALTDIAPHAGGLPRLLHGLPLHAPLRSLTRAMRVGAELASAGVLDRIAPLHGNVLEEATGAQPVRHGALALYLHWSPGGHISAMVRRQVALWHDCGFDVVFVTNATPPAADWDAVAQHCVLRLRRSNVGRDFGAWRDAAAVALARFPMPSEILLANDSVLGPFRPIAPLVDAWRAGGDGLFGMTESHGGGAHLQSYALLARGGGAVASMLAHLADLRDSRSKWRIVQRGEIGLTQRMLREGHRCAALFGHGTLNVHVQRPVRQPVNPTHHLWRVLIEQAGYPFIKTDLVRRNPARLPGVERWADCVPQAEAALMRDHLAIMSAR